ncbi:prolipoprotein diacylglyceryl transferase [Caenibacillus caldisaponilyticus]|uniref:prolipoprotein diacylglyceryl transferase n=1 Tax=Caenibacillus caldisaponilyticus TaxID=1674942 RepID=UPI0009886D67|nr:prolipoprotein diacylglyceryl transferase [Caenibacillus caldisaponilyticus]
MHKDLVTIFGYTVQTHAVISVIAILIGFGVALTMTKNTIYHEHLYNYIFWALIGAIIGARLWHVFIFQAPYYIHHPAEIIAIWRGGISILGAIVGGAVALILYTYKYRLDFWELADYLAPPMVLGMGIGRIACFFGGDAFGKPTYSDFGIVFPEGTIAHEYYGSEPLWPAVLWESQGDIVIFGLLFYLLGKNLPKGWIVALFLFLYGSLRFGLEYLRGDSPAYALGLTGGQWTALGFIAAAMIMAIYLIFRRPRRKPAADQEVRQK